MVGIQKLQNTPSIMFILSSVDDNFCPHKIVACFFTYV